MGFEDTACETVQKGIISGFHMPVKTRRGQHLKWTILLNTKVRIKLIANPKFDLAYVAKFKYPTRF